MDDQQQVHRALENTYRCLQDRYRHVMEEQLRDIAEEHCREMKETHDRVQEQHQSQYKLLEEQALKEHEQRYQETEEQEQIMNEQYQQYRQSQEQAMEKQYRQLQQQQNQALDDKYRRCKAMRERALEEKYKCYRKQQDCSSEDQYRRDLEELHCIKEGLCQKVTEVSGWCNQGQLQYRVEEQNQPPYLAKKGAKETPFQSHPQDPCGQNQPQTRATESPQPESPEPHPDYNADDESSSECRSPASESSRKDVTKTSTNTGDRPSPGSSCQAGGAPNSPQSSCPHTAMSDAIKDLMKGELPKEGENWLTSVLIEYMQSIYNQLRSSDMPKMANKEHRDHFMAFLEEEKVFEALQEVADKAVCKLTQGCRSKGRESAVSDTRDESGSFCQRSGEPDGANDVSSSSTVCQSYSPVSSLDRDTTRSSISLEEHVYKVETQLPEGFWDQASLQDSQTRACMQEETPPCRAISDEPCSTSTPKSCDPSSDASEQSACSKELLFIGSVCSMSDVLSQSASSSCSIGTCSDRGNTSSPDSHVCSSSGRYTQFLEYLEQQNVFSALQDVVNKATSYLTKPEMKETSSSFYKDSSVFTPPDSSSFRIFNPNSQVLMVTSGHKIEQSTDLVYDAEGHPPGPGQQLRQQAGPQPPQGPTQQPPQVPGPTLPQVPTPEPLQEPDLQPIKGPGLKTPKYQTPPLESGPQPALVPEQQPPSKPSPPPKGPADRASMTSRLSTISPTATTLSTLRPEADLTSTAHSSRASSAAKTKISSSRSRVSQNTPNPKPATSKLRSKDHQKKESDATLHKRAISVSRKLRSDPSKPPCTFKPRTGGTCKFANQEIMECLIESAFSLMVYKHKMERRLTSKIGFVAQPISELYNQRMAELRQCNGPFKWPVFIQSLSVHEEHCLASHPLWAGTKTTNRFHLAWESKVRRRRDSACPPTSDTSCQEESATLPDISTISSPRTSLYTQDLTSTRPPSLASSTMPMAAMPKL